MSATETPLVTPGELNKILTEENSRLTIENADLRMREKVGKEANDKMAAQLATAEAGWKDASEGAIIATRLAEENRKRAEAAEARVRELEADNEKIGGHHLCEKGHGWVVNGQPCYLCQQARIEAHVADRDKFAKQLTESEALTADYLGKIADRESEIVDLQSRVQERELANAREFRRAEDWKAEAKEKEARLAAVLGAIPFPSLSAGTADSLAYPLEQNGTFGQVTNEAAAAWLRDIAEKLRKLDAARTGDAAHPDSVKLAAVIRAGNRLRGIVESPSPIMREIASFAVSAWDDAAGEIPMSFAHRLQAKSVGEHVDEVLAKAGAGLDVAALLEDKARLDWLLAERTTHVGVIIEDEHPAAHRPLGEKLKDFAERSTATWWLLSRAAIDAARKEGGA